MAKESMLAGTISAKTKATARAAQTAAHHKAVAALPSGTKFGIAGRTRGQLTDAQRSSLKQSPAEKKARIASAQKRTGTLVSNFAKRQRGEKTPTGVGRPAKRPAESGRASTGAAEAVSSLSRPIKRKATRTNTRYGGR